MIVAVILFLGLALAIYLYVVLVFKDKELIDKKELKELKLEYRIMDQAMREAFVNPDQAQLYISNAFTQIQENKLSQTKEIK